VTWSAFSPINYRLAELTIAASSSEFGARSVTWPPEHAVGRYGAPRWLLTPRLAPDDEWTLDTLPAGDLIAADHPVPNDIEWEYLRWADGSRAESGIQTLLSLPAGRYLLVRSSLQPRRTELVLLGNGYESSPPNTVVLRERRPYYAMVIGPHPDRPPATDRPLIGFIALNYVGDSVMHGALFFDCLDSEGKESAGGELVLVIPVTGELVMDALARFSAEDSARDLKRWSETGARELAAALIDPKKPFAGGG